LLPWIFKVAVRFLIVAVNFQSCREIFKVAVDFQSCREIFKVAVDFQSCREIFKVAVDFQSCREHSMQVLPCNINAVPCTFQTVAVTPVGHRIFGLFHGDSLTKPSNNHVNIISNTFLDMKASNINDIQGLKYICFLGIQLGYQDSKFSIPSENPVSHFWILVTGTISIIPCPIQISFHNSRYYYKLQ
jgi:hypothetical protein